MDICRKWCPISFSVPGPDEDGSPEEDGPGSCLYIMEKVATPEPDQGQFEAFVYTSAETSFSKSWYRHSLPPPPYVLHPSYQLARIYSQAVLGGGSHLCISALGHGTYCFDTASREWSHAGDWILPVYGMAEYVPELNLWFGLSEKDLLPCAFDLSSVLEGRKPTLTDIWRINYPPDWCSHGITNIISLGAGRFCIVKFFETMQEGTYCFGEPVVDEIFAVFTGVELLSSCAKGVKLNGNGKGTCSGNHNGKQGIRMVKHMSKVHVLTGYTTIEAIL
nr:unnamed protein product [Digitaria exilis]